MKNVVKYILISVVLIFAQWWFIGYMQEISDTSWEVSAITAVGYFLSVEMVVCTGLILSKIGKK